MTPERWSRIREIFGAALETPEPEHPRFLDSACGGDADLRSEVERMLAAAQETSWQSPAAELSATAAELIPGDTLAHFRIEARLGAGGMGVVYRVTDSRLGREVALKVLAGGQDSEARARFAREAKVVAALNHSHICSLYDVGPDFLVMELVEGPTLAERIARGAIPQEEALAIARQIAQGLEAAHEKGVVHRDLKPANIKVSTQGVVKILDFGLATLAQPALSADDDPENSPTRILTLSRTGVIMGTAAYMAPEQARGRAVDKRADIWAFGVVLYEMLTGRPLFRGEDVGETLAAVLKQEPDLSAAPPKVRRLLRSCLEKQPERRLRDIADAWLLLSDDTAPAPPSRGASRTLWPAASAVALVALTAVSWLHFRETPPAPGAALRFQIAPPESAVAGALLNVSPDGRKVAFIAARHLWVHYLESGETRDLAEASGTPFWSPDSRFIGYAALGRKLMRIEATGGVPHTLADYRGAWGAGTWSQNDLIVFSDRKNIFRVPAAGGLPIQLSEVDPDRQDTIQYSPVFLPDGTHFLYTARSTDERKSAVLVGSIDAKPEAQSRTPLVRSFWGAQYAASAEAGVGCVLFIRDDTLMAQPMDLRRLMTTGQAVPVAEHIEDGRAFSVSGNGVLVFQQQSTKARLTWFDREGAAAGTIGDLDFFRTLALSRDGTRALLATGTRGQASNLWLLDLARGLRTRIGLSSASEDEPVWTPAGDRVIFASNRGGGAFDLYQQAVNGAGAAEALCQSAQDKVPLSCSRDGRYLLYSVNSRSTGSDIWLLPLEGPRKPLPFLQTEADEASARFSPDGRWVAYSSNESGRNEIYVRSFSMKPGALAVESGDKHLISDSGGVSPRWRGDGRELYYLRAADQMLMAVDIAEESGFRAGHPHAIGAAITRAWDAAPDGKRFLATELTNPKPQPYTVVLNWQSTLKR